MTGTAKRGLLFFLLLLSFPFLCHALTLANLKTEVRRNLQDNPPSNAPQRYTDPVLLDYINEAQKDVVNQTWLSEKTTEYVLAALVTYYALPVDFINIEQAYFKLSPNNRIVLEEYTRKTLYETYPTWDMNTGSPVYYWVSKTTQPAQPLTDTLFISYIPIPTRTTTGTVTLWYYNKVADLSSDTDIPFENRQELYSYHMALAYHATYRLKRIERKEDEAAPYYNLYLYYVGLIKNRLGQMPNYNPGTSIGTGTGR